MQIPPADVPVPAFLKIQVFALSSYDDTLKTHRDISPNLTHSLTRMDEWGGVEWYSSWRVPHIGVP